MKVFISWSKSQSHKVALALKEWLPSIIQTIDPYVSSEDTDKGSRWNTEIVKELEQASYGILCVTKENINEPWLLFEAGALSNKISQSLVCPFLFDLKPSQVKGPLEQFQATVFEKEDVRKLVIAINKASGEHALKEDLLGKTFDKWWPDLETKLQSLKSSQSSDIPAVEKAPQDDIIEKVLDVVRTNQRLLTSPEQLLPVDYLVNSLSLAMRQRRPERVQRMMPLIEQLIRRIQEARVHVERLLEKNQSFVENEDIQLLRESIGEMDMNINELRHYYYLLLESLN